MATQKDYRIISIIGALSEHETLSQQEITEYVDHHYGRTTKAHISPLIKELHEAELINIDKLQIEGTNVSKNICSLSGLNIGNTFMYVYNSDVTRATKLPILERLSKYFSSNKRIGEILLKEELLHRELINLIMVG